MELKDRLAALVRALPPAQRVGIAVAAVVLVMAAIPFGMWITTPSYALLYSGLDDQSLAEATTQLDAAGIDYRLEGGRVMVPRDEVHQARADLAASGITATPAVPGYELLDEQALGVSDFRQRVDLQRAVEGELTRTLAAMDTVDSATVRLVLPEDRLFSDDEHPATASVLLRPDGQLDRDQVESVTLLVAAAVEGLEPDNVTVADTGGRTLHAPGDGTTGAVTDRQQRRTREFEEAVSGDVGALLQRATDAPASAVVRADLDFDELETHTEVFEDAGTPLREQSSQERYAGNSPLPGGIVGIDGGPEANAGEGEYEREDATTEFGVGRTTTRTVQAPGRVRQLDVAVVVDDAAALGDGEIEDLVIAAAGLDPERGDRVAISRVAAPPVVEDVIDEEAGPDVMLLVQQAVALVVLLVVAVSLFLMMRRRRDPEPTVVPATVQPTPEIDEGPAPSAAPTVRDEVVELVERQPEEIATLLRGWLADRRTPS